MTDDSFDYGVRTYRKGGSMTLKDSEGRIAGR